MMGFRTSGGTLAASEDHWGCVGFISAPNGGVAITPVAAQVSLVIERRSVGLEVQQRILNLEVDRL